MWIIKYIKNILAWFFKIILSPSSLVVMISLFLILSSSFSLFPLYQGRLQAAEEDLEGLTPEDIMELQDPFEYFPIEEADEEVEEEGEEEVEEEIAEPSFIIKGYVRADDEKIISVEYEGDVHLLMSGDKLAGYTFVDWQGRNGIFEKEGETFTLSLR